jgi:uncharacterized protein
MDITPVLAESAQRITAYGGGVIRVNQEEYKQSIIVKPETVSLWQDAGTAESQLLKLAAELTDIEVLLIGTGLQGEFVPPAIRNALKDQIGAGIEIMDTGAACRTYNVLLAEGRKVAAALITV